MAREDLKGKISIEQATRRGVKYIDTVNHPEANIPSLRRKGIANPSDGVAETVELQHAIRVADLVKEGLDNHRGVFPITFEKSDKS